ncbi:MAG: aminotransferase class IV [Bacillota bacterium]
MTFPDGNRPGPPLLYLDLGGEGPGLIPAEGAAIPVGDRGLLYGDGLFETVLAVDGRLPLLPLHLERLAASAGALGIPCDPDQVGRAALAVAEAAGAGEHALRVTLTRGAGPARGYAPPVTSLPALLVTAAPYRRPDGPLTAVTASLRVNPASPLTRHKSLSALEKVLARAEAASAGADEALLLNTAGRVAEGAAANLFLYAEGRWLTPPVTEGCLPGVMRRRMIALTGAEEAPVTVEALHAGGLYLTSALMGCLPLGLLDGRPLRPGPPPPSLAELLAL